MFVHLTFVRRFTDRNYLYRDDRTYKVEEADGLRLTQFTANDMPVFKQVPEGYAEEYGERIIDMSSNPDDGETPVEPGNETELGKPDPEAHRQQKKVPAKGKKALRKSKASKKIAPDLEEV